MPVKVVESIKFTKDIRNLKKRYRAIESDIEPLIERLEAGETPGDRVTGSKYPVYKVRVINSNIKKGQSGGYRVIYYIRTPEAILLTNIYSKSDLSDISNKEVEDVIARYEPEVTISETEELEDGDRSTS